jgi:hypothetical protein
MKHWTEPNGIFIVNLPINWHYKNPLVDNKTEDCPYSFVPYEESIGCFQLSCYPISQKGISAKLPVQKSGSKIKWLESIIQDQNTNAIFYHAQVDDMLCIAKFIYASEHPENYKILDMADKIKLALDSFRIIPKNDRKLAKNLNSHDNFIASLCASYDLLNNAIASESYTEMIVILASQIDAFLRASIVIKEQLNLETDDINVKYLYQSDDEKGINERTIYKKAFELNIINNDTLQVLNDLYDLRNRVIHRYIISYLTTKKVAKIAYNYAVLHEKIRLTLNEHEKMQTGKEFGIYGKGFNHKADFDDNDIKRAYAGANDKHLIEKLYRKI